MQDAILDRDLEAFRRLWAPEFMVNAPRNVVVPNREAVLDVFRKGIAHYERFDVSIEALRVEDDVAVVMGAETVEPVGAAPRAGTTVDRRFTHVWERRNGTWRLTARHANIVPE